MVVLASSVSAVVEPEEERAVSSQASALMVEDPSRIEPLRNRRSRSLRHPVEQILVVEALEQFQS